MTITILDYINEELQLYVYGKVNLEITLLFSIYRVANVRHSHVTLVI